MRSLFLASALLLSLGALEVGAQNPDDEYVRIYNLVQQADALAGGGQRSQARENYLEAQRALQTLQKGRPDWNPQVVQYRLRYLTERLQSLANEPEPRPEPDDRTKAPSPATDDPTNRSKRLQEQIQQLTADKEILAAKLQQALSAQPAAVDPRELKRAEERVATLEKEMELLRVNLRKAESRPDKSIAPAALEETQKALADATARLKRQNESIATLNLEKQALQDRLRARADDPGSVALKQENRRLKQQLHELRASAERLGTADELRKRVDALQADLAAYKSRNEVLLSERKILEDRLKELASLREAELKARTRILERDVADARAEAQSNAATVSALQMALKRAREENASLSNLRARLEVLEARKVPYSAEETALLRVAEVKLAKSDSPTNRKARSELPVGGGQLVVEAERAFSARRFDEAERKYEQVLRLDEKNLGVLGNLAAAQIEQNRLDEAEKTLKRALTEESKDAFSLSLLGVIKVRQEKYDEALEALSRSAQLDPQNAETHNYLGIVLVEKGLRGPAEAALRRAIMLAPGHADAHHNLAVVYATAKPPSLELARWHYQKALTAGHPRNPELENTLDSKRSAAAKPPANP